MAVTIGALAVLVAALPRAAAQDATGIDPAALPRGADPAVAHLVRDTIRDGDLRVPATTRGRHEALWAVAGGYVVRDYNVGRSRSTVLTFISRSGQQRVVARSRHWVEAAVSPSGRRLAVQTWHGALEKRSDITVVGPRTGRVVARRELRLATLAAVTESRVLVGRRAHWRDPATQWWNYETDRWWRIHGQAAVGADVRQDKVVFATPGRGEFCNRVAVLSRRRGRGGAAAGSTPTSGRRTAATSSPPTLTSTPQARTGGGSPTAARRSVWPRSPAGSTGTRSGRTTSTS
ncbi:MULTISPECIES: hypothetical protein [unclassified Nocardioides]|uniref:hypothetical protein n=1 Tax=unclassified Nocardioides TaxID=2615069 RepID=UPI0009EF905D|nr:MULTISPECIES: hypothetical protein [unclassified Nocardioides]GAW48886.1 hypothetical protein PD653B2_1201 [Nocardioides sp. PD653-B2]GAW54523.1 hypothetical protein PD653_1931 [Nocardioides sp. PD653]